MTSITESAAGFNTPGSAGCSGTAGSGAALRQAREERGATAAALARRASISASYLSQLEIGSSRLTPSLLSRLAQTLGVDAEALAGDPATRTTSALPDLFATTPTSARRAHRCRSRRCATSSPRTTTTSTNSTPALSTSRPSWG